MAGPQPTGRPWRPSRAWRGRAVAGEAPSERWPWRCEAPRRHRVLLAVWRRRPHLPRREMPLAARALRLAARRGRAGRGAPRDALEPVDGPRAARAARAREPRVSL